MTSPIRSPGRSSTNSFAIFLAASILLGLKSLANILPLTSKLNTMSIPSLLIFSDTLEDLGLAKAITRKATARQRNTKDTGLSLVFHETGRCLIPSREDTRKAAFCLLCFLIYQKIKTGINNNSQKKAGLAKVIFLKSKNSKT